MRAFSEVVSDGLCVVCDACAGGAAIFGVGTQKGSKYLKMVVEKDGELAIFNMVANSFLPHQVRNTVGTLIKVGLSKMTIAEFHSIIEAKKPSLAGPTAPAYGLCLMQINYPHSFWEDYNENL